MHARFNAVMFNLNAVINCRRRHRRRVYVVEITRIIQLKRAETSKLEDFRLFSRF